MKVRSLSQVLLTQRRFLMEPDPSGGYRKNPNPIFDKLTDWYFRLKPWREELATLKRLFARRRHSLDEVEYGKRLRYFVRFPYLTSHEFNRWQIITDSSFHEGYSRAEFVRSLRSAAGASTHLNELEEPKLGPDGKLLDLGRHSLPIYSTLDPKDNTLSIKRDLNNAYLRTYGVDLGEDRVDAPSRRTQMLRNALDSLTGRGSNEFHGGYGLFRGYISTKVPETGDLARAGFASLRCPDFNFLGFPRPYNFVGYNSVVIRFRGDGRTYRLNFQFKSPIDVFHFDLHQFMMYTRGGPHWQIAKIPLHKFYLVNKGRIVRRQYAFQHAQIRQLTFTLMDGIPGPFSLEIDYIAFYNDGQFNCMSVKHTHPNPSTAQGQIA